MPTSSRSRQEAARDKENSAPVHKLKLQMTASPPLTKKALGRVDLNSPRANAPTSAAKSHKKTSINKSTAALTHLSETRVKTARVPVFAPANDAPADGGTSTENQTKYTLDRDAEHKDRGAKLRSKRDEKLAEVTEVVLESVTHEDPDGSKAATGTTTHHKEEGQDREQLRRRSCVPQLDVEFSAASEEIRDEVVVLATKANKTSRDVDTDATAAMGADDRKSFGTATPRLKEMPELPSESAACVQLFAEEIEQEKEKAQGMENQLTSSETQTVVDAGDDIPANSDDHANPSGTQGDTLRRRGDAAVDPSVGARPSCVHDEPLPTDFPADPVVATGKTHRAMIDDDTRRVVDGSQHLRFSKGGTRVLCTLTGQEIMPDYMEILNYLGSARVQQLSVEGPFVMSVSCQISAFYVGTRRNEGTEVSRTLISCLRSVNGIFVEYFKQQVIRKGFFG